MIDFIEGKIASVEVDHVVVQTGGLGYRVFCPHPQRLNVGEERRLYTHLVVRDDAHHLFGFVTLEERQLFRQFLDVSGIGPRVGLSVIGAGSPGEVIDAVFREDLTFLTRIPGIGKKTAQRIVLELKDKLQKLEWAVAAAKSRAPSEEVAQGVAMQDVIDALIALGYNEEEAGVAAREAQQNVGDKELGLDQWIRLALQARGKR